MRDYDFDDSIGYWICSTSHLYQRSLDKALLPHGVTFRQFQVLAWLVFAGPQSQADLAERMMIEPPTLVGILDRMQSQRLVQRVTSQIDRRCKHVQIAEGAQPVWDQVVDCLTRTRDQATANMSDAEVATLKDLLRRVQENLMPPIPEIASPAQHTVLPAQNQDLAT
ncbi:MarR family transcriptional regulator [Stieleria sp. TO1_6]|uniref:MarR family winged helix-turn-helix transcriptional regulator n=1 Tax=Stieleria tagensis TaxID=2956795 RepID=UPI00209B25EE|nr:MarR family transcriptional regulator [Stieleria tagensis]MCO8121087.1 MarR family transcriptional regulator [Stieleria tagensis]